MGPDMQQAPRPFTFAGQHVRIGAAVGRFWGITLLGMTRGGARPAPCQVARCAEPRPAVRALFRAGAAYAIRALRDPSPGLLPYSLLSTPLLIGYSLH